MKYTPELNIAEASINPVFLKFSATWCNPCKSYAPILTKAAEQLGMGIIEVDIDEYPDVAKQYGVRGVPSTFIISNGAVVSSFSGVTTIPNIIKIVEGKNV